MHHSSSHTHQEAPVTQGRTIRWAKYYDGFVRFMTLGRENAVRTETIRLASIQSGAAVLDVGCGTGSLTLLAKAAAGNQGVVYGIDAAPEMIATARKKAVQQNREVQFQVGLIEALPFPDSMFDIVLSSLMFHHLPDDLKREGLTEIYRVLKPGGRLLIVDIKQTANVAHHFSLIALFHHGLASGVDDLSPVMTGMGYIGLESGNMPMMKVGYVRGQRGS
jgi:ubiquinone/menaquinone biosynthesis C-methylase UbiE